MHFGEWCFPLQISLPVGWSAVGVCQGLSVQSIGCYASPRELLYCVLGGYLFHHPKIWVRLAFRERHNAVGVDRSRFWRCYCSGLQTVACRRALCLYSGLCHATLFQLKAIWEKLRRREHTAWIITVCWVLHTALQQDQESLAFTETSVQW